MFPEAHSAKNGGRYRLPAARFAKNGDRSRFSEARFAKNGDRFLLPAASVSHFFRFSACPRPRTENFSNFLLLNSSEFNERQNIKITTMLAECRYPYIIGSYIT